MHCNVKLKTEVPTEKTGSIVMKNKIELGLLINLNITADNECRRFIEEFYAIRKVDTFNFIAKNDLSNYELLREKYGRYIYSIKQIVICGNDFKAIKDLFKDENYYMNEYGLFEEK